MNTKLLYKVIFWSLSCIVTAQISYLACIVGLVQHFIVLVRLIKKDFYGAFLNLLLFTTVSLEISSFVIGIGKGSIYCFFNVPFLHGMLFVIEMLWLYLSMVKSGALIKKDTVGSFVYRWLNILIITAVITAFIIHIVNDNNILDSGNYPKTSLLELIGFWSRFSLFKITLIYIYVFGKFHDLYEYCKTLMIGLIISSVVGALVGFRGYYGDESTMLSSLAMGFSPCLLLLYEKGDKSFSNRLLLIIPLLAIVTSFLYPSVIGSKWYIVILFTVMCFVYRLSGIKSAKYLYVVGILCLFLIPYLTEYVVGIFGVDSYVAFKLNQTLNVLNFTAAQSSEEYISGIGGSPLFRFDELHNIFIEYTQKPLYALFGKGFGGTTLHHTDLLPWETYHGAFSVDQVKMHAYYAMHETVAQVFLTHGFVGLFFVFNLLIKLLKSITCSGWAVMGFLFLFFYWDYGSSFSIGVLAMIMALYQLDKKNLNL